MSNRIGFGAGLKSMCFVLFALLVGSCSKSSTASTAPSPSSGGTKLAYTQGATIVVCNLDGTGKQTVFTSPSGDRPEVGSFY